MDEDHGDLMLNLSSYGSSTTSTKTRVSRQDRLDQKKAARKADLQKTTDNIKQNINSNTQVQNVSNKRKRTTESEGGSSVKRHKSTDRGSGISRDEPAPRRGHPASLFTNNPDIPHMQAMHIDQVKEQVFTGKNFSELGLHPHMVTNLDSRLEVQEMTHVQRQAIPVVLQGKDALIKSQTGSGKTLSYAIPMVQKLQALDPRIERTDGPYAIVIVPTRELAVQSIDTFKKLVYPFTWIVPGAIMGGEKRKSEKARLRKGINILVATPGRLLDHIENTESLGLRAVQWLVIDEADRLLEMGFQKEVAKIVSALDEKMSSSRQTLLLSATLTSGVESLAGMSMRDPVVVDATTKDSATSLKQTSPPTNPSGRRVAGSTASDALPSGGESGDFSLPEKLHHHYVVVPLKLRLVTLAAFLLWKCKFSNKRSKVLVFFATQDSVEFHHTLFSNTLCNPDQDDGQPDLDLFKLHGDLPQNERTVVFREFSEASAGVLFCTDVAARGLDLPQVRWIIQYNPPASPTDYIHRVGRTARIGSHGNGLLFLSPAEVAFVQVLGQSKINIEEASMDDILKTLLVEADRLPSGNKLKGRVPSTMQEAAACVQSRFEEFVQSTKDSRSIARKAYQSCVRAYATYPSSLKHIFHIKTVHLGHLATSFSLQEAPTKIGRVVGKYGHMDSKKDKFKGSNKHQKQKLSSMSEYDSGISKAAMKLSQKKPKKKPSHRKR